MSGHVLPILKALADETRLELVRLLLTHDLCVGALARRLNISEGAVSQHLRHLRDVGLVRGEKRGYWTHYVVQRGLLKDLAGQIEALTGLLPCREGLCIKKGDHKQGCNKEGGMMCDCRCQKPEQLKGMPQDCNLDKIMECHGDEKGHPCLEVGSAHQKKEGELDGIRHEG